MPTTERKNSRTSTSRLAFAADKDRAPIHYLFRYPAKFHPPVARALLERYCPEGGSVLDPFCGSGTLLVEAQRMGLHSTGLDIDPVAVFVSQVKTRRVKPAHFARSCELVEDMIAELERPAQEYSRLQFDDFTQAGMRRALSYHDVDPPPIPNLTHWFRRYVVVDLCRLYELIDSVQVPKSHRELLRLAFASIIRASSNADPVPVSGLEVTSHMRRKDARGRVINPFRLYIAALKKTLAAVVEHCAATSADITSRTRRGDATQLSCAVTDTYDAVITSPPYHNAVDYYRRHTLEMYWLGLVNSHDDRLTLLPRYIGRARVPQSHPILNNGHLASTTATRWLNDMTAVDPVRATAFKHYIFAMASVANGLYDILPPGAPAVLVVGKSQWNGQHLPTDVLFREVMSSGFTFSERLWYPLKNRYMTYARRNGANIDKEHVLVFNRR